MAHSGSADLLSLLMRGGTLGSSSPGHAGSEGLGEDQLVTPVNQSKPTARSAHSREATPSGQETLEALFSSLRGSAPPNSNISPSAVSNAERQNTSQFQAATASPSNSTLNNITAMTSPQLSNSQGRNLLLSMLNVRSPPAQEAGFASTSVVAAEIEEPPRDAPREEAAPINDKPEELYTASEVARDGDAFPPQGTPTPQEESGLDNASRTSPEKAEVIVPNLDTRQNGNSKLLDSLKKPNSAYVEEGTPDSLLLHTITTHGAHEQSGKTHLTNFDDLESLGAHLQHAVPAEGEHTELDAEEHLGPLHELIIEAVSPHNAGEDFVIDRVPISRFSSPNQYTKGKQIAVKGLIGYGTRGGRVRIIDPDTGARLIKKLHSGLVSDMDLSEEITLSSNGENVRRLATCYSNELKVWQIPSSFSGNDATNKIVYQVSMKGKVAVDSVKFNPSNPKELAFTIAGSPSIYLVHLDTEEEESPSLIPLGQATIDEMSILKLKAPVTAATWSSNGSILTGISTQNHLAFWETTTKQAYYSHLGSNSEDLDPVCQIELLQSRPNTYPSAMLVTHRRGLVVELYDLMSLSRPTSRLHVDIGQENQLSEGQKKFARTSVLSGHAALLIAESTDSLIHSVKFSLPQGTALSNSHSDFSHWCDTINIKSQAQQSSLDLIEIPHFVDYTSIPTTNNVLQMVTAELSERPGVFYLHADGFEQISLRPELFESSVVEPQCPDIVQPLLGATLKVDASPQPNNDFLQLFDDSVKTLERAEEAVTNDANALNTIAMPPLPVPTASQVYTDMTPGKGTNETHVEDMMDTLQHHLAEQNRIFAQMLASQHRFQEARFLQLSRDIASLRQQQSDPFEGVSRAIRSELRDNLLPVIATALAEIGQSSSTSHSSSSSAAVAQQEKLIQRCADTMSHLFSSFSQQLGPAITEALSGTLERHLARLTIAQAEQVDTAEQIRQILLTEQMKQEQVSTRLEAEMQTIKSQLAQFLNHEPLSATSTAQEKMDGLPKLERSSVPLERPSTPDNLYEDMFLRELKDNPDPLRRLIDEAPSSRVDRVLPYDGQPRITAPAFLALCMRLAKDFDNDVSSLDRDNGRVRLVWILACLRASKWAKSERQIAALLPRVFTGVMHSLNRRAQKLTDTDDVQEVRDVLQTADELSGLW